MPERAKLTVIIPTHNEEANLPACLRGVEWADEVFVVDSFSTDRTPEIAREHGVRFVQHEYVNSATQKNWAIPQATHDWVMIVDADERVTPELRDEVLEVLATPDPADGYDIGRLNYFMGRPIRHCGWQSDTVLRLFRRDRGRYRNRQVHADVIVEGRVGRLNHKFIHNTFRGFDHYMKKFDQYTTWAASDRDLVTRKVGLTQLALRPWARFVKQYFFKLGFLDGKAGFVICTLAAYSVFLKYAKLCEMREHRIAEKDGQ